MGTEQVQLRVTAYVSNHNSEQDKVDRENWTRFVDGVRELAQYAEDWYGLEIMVEG